MLEPTIEAALTSSNFLVLMASPEAAHSPWVERAGATWFAHWGSEQGATTLLIALTDGELVWDESIGDFNWGPSTPLPPSLKGKFKKEPLWVDLRPYRTGGEQASKQNQDFVSRSGKIAARILGTPLEDLFSEELRQQRKALRLAWSAACALLVLAGVAGVASYIATKERDRALSSQSLFLADRAAP